ncbi:Abi family protein [Bradyrhizobium sp. 182]|uniref:Abi family protein n=1 Tax=unclassified Bradyrhizobium TaxID=2631580 RepID=UPI001FF910F8|nr:Abi family protein [Bradyrhizobium sp. CW12]MCK1527565.1 Abi family protein [Bradyrhizobium sp. 182]MCK1646804.1 Abi family protein [Bradyrhizobium sp. 154]
MAYAKPFLTLNQQIALIKGRGLAISDDAKASSYLGKIGYYRLSGYWYPYRQSNVAAGKLIVGDNFKPGSELAEIVDLYVFDKKFRLLLLDVIERIEIALRVQITLQLGQMSADAHRDPALLHGNFARRPNPKTGLVKHREWIRRQDEAFDKSKEEFAKHFRSKYPGENPPIWIAAEVWDFGAMSMLFSGLNKIDQSAIASVFNVRSFDIMENWLHAINVARNVCAHHSRLWNKPSPVQPKWPSKQDCPDLAHLLGNTHAQTRVYGMACICAFLLKSINPGSGWTSRFTQLVGGFPKSNIVSLSGAGFPAGWERESIWQ